MGGHRIVYVSVNDVDAQPCACGGDLGPWSGSASQPRLVEGTSGVIMPTSLVAIAVRAPETRFVWCTNESGRVVSRVRIHKGDLHVMYSPLGGSMQFNLSAELFEPADSESVGAFGAAAYRGVIEVDPRAILLREFWARPGYPQRYDVEPFAVVRTGPAMTLGQFALVSIGTRWFDSDGTVHADLGTCYIIRQGRQTRFLKPTELGREFTLKP